MTRIRRYARTTRGFSWGFAFIGAAVLAGCSGPRYVDRQLETPGALEMFLEPVVYEVDQALAQAPPRCIAVLPFTSAQDDAAPSLAHAERVRRAVYAHLAPRAPRDVELAAVDAALASMSPRERRDNAQIGRALACDALLLGTLVEHRERYLALYSEIVLRAELELVRADDGAVLWRARHVASSRGGGLPVSPVALIEGAVRAATNLGGEQLDRVTDDLARRLVRALPDPVIAAPAAPPAPSLTADSHPAQSAPRIALALGSPGQSPPRCAGPMHAGGSATEAGPACVKEADAQGSETLRALCRCDEPGGRPARHALDLRHDGHPSVLVRVQDLF